MVQVFDRFGDIVTQAEEDLRSGLPLLIIAQVQHGGLALTESFRERFNGQRIPIVMIDTHGDLQAAIRALQLGVVDYLTSQMTAEEIEQRVARLYTLISATSAQATFRGSSEQPKARPPKDEMSFDASVRAIRRGDMWVSLSPIEWRLFEQLLQNRGSNVPCCDLVQRGLGRTLLSPMETSLLRLHMSRLRAKLQQHFGRELNIITLRGRGYMLA